MTERQRSEERVEKAAMSPVVMVAVVVPIAPVVMA
jgi:hypothetical protein